jgi:hypothetical protein
LRSLSASRRTAYAVAGSVPSSSLQDYVSVAVWCGFEEIEDNNNFLIKGFSAKDLCSYG